MQKYILVSLLFFSISFTSTIAQSQDFSKEYLVAVPTYKGGKQWKIELDDGSAIKGMNNYGNVLEHPEGGKRWPSLATFLNYMHENGYTLVSTAKDDLPQVQLSSTVYIFRKVEK